MTVGNSTVSVIKNILSSRKLEVQTYRMCLGVLNYSKKYGNHVLEECCRQALVADKINYTYIKNSIPAIAEDLCTPQERSRINEERNRGGFVMHGSRGNGCSKSSFQEPETGSDTGKGG